MKSEEGFTLGELAFVILIIGIITAAVVVRFVDLRDSARAAACMYNQAAIETAASIGYAEAAIEGSAAFPASLAAIVNSGLLRAIPSCPSDGTYSYDSEEGTVICSKSSHVR